jgi:hypothetical protein
MMLLPTSQTTQIAEKYASEFIRDLEMGHEVEQKCEWTCLLWTKDHWATEAGKSQITLQQTKEHLTDSDEKSRTVKTLFVNSQFLNTVAQVYSKLFDNSEQTCSVKVFVNCPFMGQRKDLLTRGSLASVFVTILHKATLYAMLDRHPIDSGLLDEEYRDVYGIDLTSYQDLEKSLIDGRFSKLFDAVTKRASELAGLESKPL